MIRKKAGEALICAATVAAVMVGAVLAPIITVGAATGPTGSFPAGLPSHVMVGLANDPGDLSWMTGSGVPWDARYQYLSGGVNTAPTAVGRPGTARPAPSPCGTCRTAAPTATCPSSATTRCCSPTLPPARPRGTRTTAT